MSGASTPGWLVDRVGSAWRHSAVELVSVIEAHLARTIERHRGSSPIYEMIRYAFRLPDARKGDVRQTVASAAVACARPWPGRAVECALDAAVAIGFCITIRSFMTILKTATSCGMGALRCWSPVRHSSRNQRRRRALRHQLSHPAARRGRRSEQPGRRDAACAAEANSECVKAKDWTSASKRSRRSRSTPSRDDRGQNGRFVRGLL